MANEETRIAVLESEVKTLRKDLDRIRDHIRELLTFMHEWQGALGMAKWVLGFVGFSNFLLIIKAVIDLTK